VRILLDENLDWRLGRDLPGHTVESVPLIGWGGIKNGVLLAEAEKQFEVLITMDSKMVNELDISKLRIALYRSKGSQQPFGRHPASHAKSPGASSEYTGGGIYARLLMQRAHAALVTSYIAAGEDARAPAALRLPDAVELHCAAYGVGLRIGLGWRGVPLASQ
jgi:hypothetical protein